MKHTLILLLLFTLLSCSNRQQQPRYPFDLTGAWVLRHVEYPSGTEEDYSMQGDGTSCLIYDRENRLCVCDISTTPTGLLIQPTGTTTVTLVEKGGGEWLYLEDGDPHPLLVTDSTITIQRMGIRYTYSYAEDIYNEWGDDLRDIFASTLINTETANTQKYVLSAHERQQASYIQWLLATVAVGIISFVAYYIVSRRRRRQMQLQLR